MPRMRRVLCVFMLIAASAAAQSTGTSETETIQQLVLEVKELKAKVQALEARQNGSEIGAPANPSVAEAEAAPQVTSSTFLQEAHEVHGIQWRGFGEVNYKVLDQRQPEFGQLFGFVPGSAGNFSVGDFDLLLTSRISDKASVLSEIVFGEEDAQEFSVDVERLLFKYDYNDHLRMSFGRYHTGIGYYNTAFHTGRWLQATTDRPLIMEFANDGGLLPTQAVGVSITGEIPSHGLGLNYTAEYGSSDTIRPDINEEGAEDDENNGNHINLGLFIRPDKFPGLQIGGSFYHDRISDFDKGPSVRLGQSIVNAHIIYNGHGFEFLNEGFLIRHAYENSPVVYKMPAFYTQLSKRLGPHWRPYFRYQYINANPNSIFDDVSLRHGPSFGSRYDFNDNVAFKLQLDHTVRRGLPDLNGLQTQLAFTF